MPWNPYTGRMELGPQMTPGYNGFYGQNYNPTQLPSQQVIRVNGTEGAKALQMAPNSSVFAADETDPNRIFLCITDGAGFKTIRPIRGTFEDLEQKTNPIEERIAAIETQNKNLIDRLTALEARTHDKLNSTSVEQPTRRRNYEPAE